MRALLEVASVAISLVNGIKRPDPSRARDGPGLVISTVSAGTALMTN
jgi:hypothetical protein